MSRKLKIAVAKGAAALTLGFAAVVGASHLVQSGGSAGVQADRIASVQLASAQTDAADLPADPMTPQLPARSLVPGATQPPAATRPAGVTEPADCGTSFTAQLKPGGMVGLRLSAPCSPETRVQVRHDRLTFDALTDANGVFAAEVPALAPIAGFQADLGGETFRTIAAIPDFESFTHVALQWQGQTGLQIHALEFGAGYDGEGHIWSKAPQSAMRAVRARGGFMTRLGDETLPDAKVAEIYSFPTGTIQRGGTVRLVVEAQVTPYSCGGTVRAQALQPDAGGTLQATELTLEIPACDAVGDILVLKNLLRDMKIASN